MERTSLRSREVRVLFVLAALAVAAVATLLGATHQSKASNDGAGVVMASASLRWPSYTLRDWVDFADQVAVLRITSEKRMEMAADVRKGGSGYVGRTVTATVEKTLWRSPGSPQVRTSVSFRTWGWALREAKLIPMVDSESVRLGVGDLVIAPLLRSPEGDWAVLAPGAVIQIVGSRTVFAAAQRRAYPELSGRLDDVVPDEVGVALTSTEPSADRSYLRSLDADARARALARR